MRKVEKGNPSGFSNFFLEIKGAGGSNKIQIFSRKRRNCFIFNLSFEINIFFSRLFSILDGSMKLIRDKTLFIYAYTQQIIIFIYIGKYLEKKNDEKIKSYIISYRNIFYTNL